MPKRIHFSDFKESNRHPANKATTSQNAQKIEELKHKSKLNKTLFKARSPLPALTHTMADALIASVGEGLIVVDEYGQISQINQPALDILRYERDEMMGSWLPQILPSYTKDGRPIPDQDGVLLQALVTGLPVSATVNYRRKDGSLVPVFKTASPFLVKGKPRGAIIVFRDVTQELKIEQAKDEFVSLASHQLRTPLTSIRLFAELLQDQTVNKLTDKQLDYIDKILFSTERMINLVTDLLNITRLNLGQLNLNSRPVSLVKIATKRLEEIQPLADSRGIELTLDNHLDINEQVIIDRDLIGQAVHNLLSNAVRYSPPKNGRVVITLNKTPNNYRISVSDNGIGVPVSAKGQIYQRFYRASNATRATSEGTGLGLYLVKAVVEAYGGKTWYKCPRGGGTTFYVSLPRQKIDIKRGQRAS